MSNVIPITAGKRRHVAVVKQEFEAMQRQSKANGWSVECEGNPEPFTEYRVRPTVAEASEMCRGCPLMKAGNLCAEFGYATKADGIVLGGFAWVAGKPVLDDAEVQVEFDDLEDLAA